MLKVGFTALAAPGFGTVVDKIRKLPRGQSYEIQLVHLGSSLQEPDLDYVAWVEVLGDPSCVYLDDPDNILTWMPLGTAVDETAEYMNSNVLPESFDDERAWLHTLRADLDMDANRDGVVDSDETGPDDVDEDVWEYGAATTGAVILCNNDDDNDDGIIDSTNDVVDGPNDVADLAPIVIRRLGADVPEGWTVRLTVETNGDKVRIFDALDPSATAIITPTESTYDIPPEDIGGSGAPLTYGIEATEYPGWPNETFDGLVTISLSILNPAGAVQCEDRVQARVAPWLMPSHLDTVDTVYVTDTFPGRGLGDPGGPAPAFPVRLSTALAPTGIPPTVIPSFDPWPQDQYEIGYHSAPGYGWSSVLLNSPRIVGFGEPLQAYAETDILGSNFGLYGVSLNGTPWTAEPGTHDSFGNLEAFPALGSWTSGLEYHGHRDIGAPPHPGDPRNGMQTDLAMFLEQQDVQGRPPEEFSTDWLVIGHVDEFMSVQATGPGTFRVILASPQIAIDLLTADPGHVFTDELWNRNQFFYVPMTSTDLLDEFGDLNGELQTQINDQRTAMIGLGITDFVEVPVFFAGEDIDGDLTPDIGIAAIPDMVNLLNVNGTLIVPDPFYDPFKTAFVANVGVTPQWIDCLEYHWLDGEVHCATNVRRAPSAAAQAWWNVTP